MRFEASDVQLPQSFKRWEFRDKEQYPTGSVERNQDIDWSGLFLYLSTVYTVLRPLSGLKMRVPFEVEACCWSWSWCTVIREAQTVGVKLWSLSGA